MILHSHLSNAVLVGVQGNLLVTITGSSSATVTEVALVEAEGSSEVKGLVQTQEGSFLVQFEKIPKGAFVVRVKGADGTSSFQRQLPTSFTSSNLSITVGISAS